MCNAKAFLIIYETRRRAACILNNCVRNMAANDLEILTGSVLEKINNAALHLVIHNYYCFLAKLNFIDYIACCFITIQDTVRL